MEEVSLSPYDRKRRRNTVGKADDGEPVGKKARPTAIQSPNSEERSWHPRDSVMGFLGPLAAERPKYDSDDQSSLVSEPGSEPALSQVSEEDVAMLSSDEDDSARRPPRGRTLGYSNIDQRSILQLNRSATPGMSPKLSHKHSTGHVRSRHPQEYISAERVDVPSPIDEDEVPTPPSAAEAAGSQLELLTVNDIEMQAADNVPIISVQTERSMQMDGESNPFDHMDSTPDTIVRKTRARSGALSAGEGSPLRETSRPGLDGSFGSKRGFAMGYRPDCEKCRQKVPGHMNHFY